jgi:hypothetical protein
MDRADLKPMARVKINCPGDRHHGRAGRYTGAVSDDMARVLLVQTRDEYAAELHQDISKREPITYQSVEIPFGYLEGVS